MGVLVSPMFIYLQYFPESETRLQMLDGDLNAALSGNLWPVIENALGALGGLFISGWGDQFLAYNIPGRPVFDMLTAALAIIGVVICVVYWRKPRYAFVFLWWGMGLVPSLITGATANTTRNVGALTMMYFLPALAVWTIGKALQQKNRRYLYTLASVWLIVTAGLTVRGYFFQWAQNPEVRAAYQTTIMAAVAEADEQTPAEQETAVFSSVYPGAAHDTSIAQVIADDKEWSTRWVDGRRALVFPAGVTENLVLYVPSSADLHPLFREWVVAAEKVDIKSDDLDPFYTRYEVARPFVAEREPIAQFGEGLVLLDGYWRGESVPAGGVGEFVTVWLVTDPTQVGPVVWPIETTDIVLFTQVLTAEGSVLTQEDRLDAPSWSWGVGDVVVQVHQLFVPGETAVGDYETIVGVYDRESGTRLTVQTTQESFFVTKNLIVK